MCLNAIEQTFQFNIMLTLYDNNIYFFHVSDTVNKINRSLFFCFAWLIFLFVMQYMQITILGEASGLTCDFCMLYYAINIDTYSTIPTNDILIVYEIRVGGRQNKSECVWKCDR